VPEAPPPVVVAPVVRPIGTWDDNGAHAHESLEHGAHTIPTFALGHPCIFKILSHLLVHFLSEQHHKAEESLAVHHRVTEHLEVFIPVDKNES